MRSDVVKKGVTKAPHRSLFKASGLTDEEINKPLIGVVTSQNDIIPGHINLDKIVEGVKKGILMSGGTPLVFPTIGVCDGIAMGHEGMKYSLATRELIADSIECMAKAHAFDALVFIPNCDKIVPGMVMAALRLNIPSVVVSGGPMFLVNLKIKRFPYLQCLKLLDLWKVVLMLEVRFSRIRRKSMSYMWIMFRNVYSKFNELFM